MSGGHVLTLQSMLAAERASDMLFPALQPVVIKAVVAQTPHLDGRENRKKNMKKNILINDEYETMNMSLDVAIQ